MSEPLSGPMRLALVGATGLIGRSVMEQCVGRGDVRLTAISRREAPLPKGARMEMFVAEPEKWGEVIEAIRPSAMICALGSTWKKSGRDEGAFRAVDHDLVLATARAAQEHGVKRFVAISSVGADPHGKSLYLKVKGETERELRKIKFERLDVLRPGLLLGKRQNDTRPAEKLGALASPVLNPFMLGSLHKYRGIKAEVVARAAIAFARRKARGRFVHENEAIMKMAASLPELAEL
ncbi:NAD(P)H-binding protein [Erythrobacter sp. W53]|uniref:NAD(P)H-binding protein n=1 Tax=Erythrobacter sp. W53 TaxID=3425947 RepID=UPI003D769594